MLANLSFSISARAETFTAWSGIRLAAFRLQSADGATRMRCERRARKVAPDQVDWQPPKLFLGREANLLPPTTAEVPRLIPFFPGWIVAGGGSLAGPIYSPERRRP